MVEIVRREAVEAVRTSLNGRERFLILGAGGWFGMTAHALLREAGATHIMGTGRSARHESRYGYDFDVVTVEPQAIMNFSPTHVIDCAFLTREKVAELGLVEYVRRNLELIETLLEILRLPCVEEVITFSSGAVTFPDQDLTQNPYGHLKRLQEELIATLAFRSAVRAVLARVYAVTGPFVTRPTDYAFSDLILQSVTGEIRVSASRPVFRSFASVDDVLALSLLAGSQDDFTKFSTSGEVVELKDLAHRINRSLNLGSTVFRADCLGVEADNYVAEDETWNNLAARFDYKVADLDEQILVVAGVLLQQFKQ